jgi:hypothetical protein
MFRSTSLLSWMATRSDKSGSALSRPLRQEWGNAISRRQVCRSLVVVPLDLLASSRRGGLTGVVRDVLVDWWGLGEFASLETIGEILVLLRSDEMCRRVPWPQDRIISDVNERWINGAAVIAQENQVIWQAVLEQVSAGGPSVVLYEEERTLRDGPHTLAEETAALRAGKSFDVVVGHRRIDSVALDEFLARQLVQNAVYAETAGRFQAQIVADRIADFLIVPPLTVKGDFAIYPALIAGVDWFGTCRGTTIQIAVRGDVANLISLGIASQWEQFVRVDPPPQTGSKTGPWSVPDGGDWFGWRPVEPST